MLSMTYHSYVVCSTSPIDCAQLSPWKLLLPMVTGLLKLALMPMSGGGNIFASFFFIKHVYMSIDSHLLKSNLGDFVIGIRTTNTN